jgi:hypothetical protein
MTGEHSNSAAKRGAREGREKRRQVNRDGYRKITRATNR